MRPDSRAGFSRHSCRCTSPRAGQRRFGRPVKGPRNVTPPGASYSRGCHAASPDRGTRFGSEPSYQMVGPTEEGVVVLGGGLRPGPLGAITSVMRGCCGRATLAAAAAYLAPSPPSLFSPFPFPLFPFSLLPGRLWRRRRRIFFWLPY